MKYISREQHYENLKINFRSIAKRHAYEYLVGLIWDTRRKIREEKSKLTQIQNEQRRLKKDYKALHSLLEEFKK